MGLGEGVRAAYKKALSPLPRSMSNLLLPYPLVLAATTS
jgi:hypothetical protein